MNGDYGVCLGTAAGPLIALHDCRGQQQHSSEPMDTLSLQDAAHYLARAGVMASVSGTLTGNRAFVHRNARATDEPPLASMADTAPCLLGSLLSFTS